MINLTDSVIQKPSFEKLAEFKLSKDISEWNESILKNFYEDVDFLPKEIGVNVIVKDVDENQGYAKGSVVVFYNGKQINFPIIVKEFKLSPFDVFVHKDNKEDVYMPASEDNVKKILMSDQIATLENRWDMARGHQLIKTPGNIIPKQSINLYDASEESIYPPFAKMSHWRELAKKEDLVKLSETLVGMPDINNSFHDNTGDLITSIVELKDSQREEVTPKTHYQGTLDLNNVINAKKAVTALDTELLDTSKLVPLTAPCVAELRLYEYPSMEDFISSGDNASERFIATKIGKPITGIVIDMVDKEKFNCDNCISCGGEKAIDSNSSEEEKLKAVRNRRDQIFFSMDGKYYSDFDDYDKTGIGFYGTGMFNTPDSVEKAVKALSLVTTDDFINSNPANKGDGSDKLFAGFSIMEQGKENRPESAWLENSRYGSNYDKGIFIIYGAGSAYECIRIDGNFKKFLVNDSHVYVSVDNVCIPANVASVQKVSSVNNPVYKMVVGKAKNIYLIPESSIIINRLFIKPLNRKEFMRPDKSVQQMYEKANITKVALCVVSDGKELGYRVSGKPFEAIQKIAGLNSGILSTNDIKNVLKILGMDKEASDKAMATALTKFSNYEQIDKNVFIYGVNDDYINNNVFDGQEKTARVKGLLHEIAYGLRKDLVKEASVISDPNTVDAVLSLNFINEESLGNYIENIDEMRKVVCELSKLLVASRLGLSDIDETATKNSITGLEDVIKGLDNIKMAVK
jgi:hypothetical protein